MGSVSKPRTGHDKGTTASQASAPGDGRRASAGSDHETLIHHSTQSDRASGSGREPSHAPSQTEHSSHAAHASGAPSGSYQSSGPIQASMADNRYPPMSAQFPSPYYEFAGPSGPSYTRYSSSAPGTDIDEYDVLAHQNLVSRAPDQAFCAAQIPVTWPTAHPTHSTEHASYPSTPFTTSQYPQYPWPMAYAQPMTSPAWTGIPATTQTQFAGALPSSFQASMPGSRSIPIPIPSATSDTMSLSPDLTSPSSSVSGSVVGHRPGPIRQERKKSDSGKELAKPPARSKPMSDTQKSKADLVRDLGACWRCRRYKKSCDGPGECSNCMRGHFRVWPSSLGCRRGCLEELVGHLVPVQAQDYLTPATRMMMKQPNWRFGTVDAAQRQMIEEQLPVANNWLRLSLKVQSTGMYGPEFQSLLDIVSRYQAAQSRPNALLEASISLLDSTCDIYHNFVQSAWPLPPADINAAIVMAQRAYAGVSKQFLTSALSGRRRDWLPSFLSMCMAFCAVMIMMDAAIAVPPQAKAMVWGNVHEVSRDLRQRLYPVTTDLLRASSNGTKPFALGCWSVNEHVNPQDGSIELVRSPEGMRMLGGDKPAFDGMRSLQEWIRRNIRWMDMGTKVIRSDPFTTPEVPSIAAILKLFDL